MSKLTQAEIKAKADEIVRIDARISHLETKRGMELDPYLIEFNEKTKEIVARYDGKVAQLASKRQDLVDQVIGWLESQKKSIVLEGEVAIAANELVVGKRTIGAKKFFDQVKDRSAGFWDCLTVAIQKADKFLGKDKVDAMAEKETKLVASVKAK